jgi:hypothetical protein
MHSVDKVGCIPPEPPAEEEAREGEIEMKVAVIGGGVAELSAAIHSIAQGHEVTLYEKHESVGGRIWESRKNGYTFEMGPSMITELWVFDELFKTAGKTNPLTFSETPDFGFCIDQLLEVSRTGFRSVLDEHDRQLLTTMMTRFEKALPIIRNTVLDHPITGVFDLMGVSRLALTARVFRPLSTAVRAFHSRELEGLLSTYPAYTEKLIKDADSAALFAPMMMLIDGIYYPEGGIYRIVEEMYTACLEIGVQVHCSSEVKKIRPERNRIILDDSSFDHCIAAVDYSLAQNMLGRTTDHTAAHAYFAVCLGTDKLALPHHSFIIPEDYEKGHRRIDDGKLPDSFLIYACYTEREKPSLFLVTVLPSTQRIDYRARMIRSSASAVSAGRCSASPANTTDSDSDRRTAIPRSATSRMRARRYSRATVFPWRYAQACSPHESLTNRIGNNKCRYRCRDGWLGSPSMNSRNVRVLLLYSPGELLSFNPDVIRTHELLLSWLPSFSIQR